MYRLRSWKIQCRAESVQSWMIYILSRAAATSAKISSMARSAGICRRNILSSSGGKIFSAQLTTLHLLA